MMRARMYVCVCASVRIRAFFTRVNSGALHLWLTRRCIVFCREEKNGLCSTVKRPAKLASPPHPSTPRVRTTHFFPPELCTPANRTKSDTLFTHGSTKARKNRFARNDPSRVQPPSNGYDRIDASFLYLHREFYRRLRSIKKKKNK